MQLEPGFDWGEGFPGSSVVKNPPAMQEMQVRSRGREDPLEEEMAVHSSFLPEKSHSASFHVLIIHLDIFLKGVFKSAHCCTGVFALLLSFESSLFLI